MSVPGSEEEYPPPAPPVKKKKEILEKHDRQLRQAEVHAEKAPPDLNNSFDDLVQYLTQDMTLDLQKVKAVLVWLSRQNFVTVRNKQGGEKDTATPRGFLNLVALKKKELVHLFKTLCRKAGVPCVILSGYCKAEAKYHSARPTSPETNSRWVAVRADGQWGFVHPTMAFRRLRFKQSRAVKIEMDGEAVRERNNQRVTGYLDNDYFLPDPDHFIYMCRPQHDVWQLLEGQPWSWTRFIEVPDTRPQTPRPPPKFSPEKPKPKPSPEKPKPEPSPERPKSPPVLPINKLSVPDSEEGYPPPCPPKGRKKDIFDEKEFQRICEISKTPCEERLYYSYKDLFAHLFKSLDTDVKKAGALLSWLSVNCNNGQVTRKMLKEATDPNTPVGAIKLRCILRYYPDRLTKERFFAVLCRQAKLPCVLIRGHKKRADLYKLGSKELGQKMVWTAVHLDGDWRLINVHDAIRHLHYEEYLETDFSGNVRVEVTKSWTDKMNEFFFLTDPDEFMHFCFPDDERWQLVDQPLTRQQFLDEPWFHPPYFSSPLRITPGYGVRVQAQDGKGSVLFEGQVSEGHLFRYNLYFIEDKETSFPEDLQLESFITTTVVSKTPMVRSVFFSLPVTGTYVLEPINESGETLCKLLINCFGDTHKNQPFPGSSDIGYGFQEAAVEAGLEDASREEGMIVVREGDKVRFRFGTSSPEKRHAPVAAEGERVALKSRFEARLIQGGGRGSGTSIRHLKVDEEEGKLVVEARVPHGSKDFQIAVQIHARDEKGLTNAANYLLTSDTSMVAKAAGRTFAEQIATEMVSATEEDDVDRLEVALRESRYARLRKVQAVEQVKAQERLMTLHKNACVQAMESGDVEALESATMATHRSQVSYYIHRASWFEAAEKSLRLLKRQSSQQTTKQSTGNEMLSQKHVDEVHRFHRPSQHVHTVMTAALTLLGESTHALKEWKHIQSLLRIRGANSVLQRIKNYKRSHSKREDVKKAETLLSTCALQAVTSTGPGIAAFYHWVRSVLDQTSEPDDKQDGQTGDQTDAHTAGQVDAQTDAQAAGQADAQTGDQTAGQADAQKGVQTGARTDVQAGDQTDDLTSAGGAVDEQRHTG